MIVFIVHPLAGTLTTFVVEKGATDVLLYSLPCALFGLTCVTVITVLICACRLRYKRSSRSLIINANVDPIYETIDNGCDTYLYGLKGIAMATNDAYKETSICNGKDELVKKKEALESHNPGYNYINEEDFMNQEF